MVRRGRRSWEGVSTGVWSWVLTCTLYTWRTQPAITYRHHLILLLRCLMGLSRRSRINIQIKSNETTIPSYFCCHVILFTRSVVLSSPPWNYALVKISFCAKKFSQNDAFQMTHSKMSNHGTIDKSGKWWFSRHNDLWFDLTYFFISSKRIGF